MFEIRNRINNGLVDRNGDLLWSLIAENTVSLLQHISFNLTKTCSKHVGDILVKLVGSMHEQEKILQTINLYHNDILVNNDPRMKMNCICHHVLIRR